METEYTIIVFVENKMKELTTQEEQILEESFESIARNGVRFFTIDALAQKMGMSKKTIYKFFPTKEKLIEKTLDLFTGLIYRRFHSVMNSKKNPAEQFVAVMEFILKQASRIPVEKIAEIKTKYPNIWKRLEEFRLERKDDFQTILQTGQEQGFIRNDMNVEIVATLYIHIVNSTFQPDFFLKNNLTPNQAVGTFVKIFSTGIFTEKGLETIRNNVN